MDVKVPGMVYATSLHSPAHGNAPESWNDAAIKAMPGVIGTVKLNDGIAVVAEQFPQAMAARAATKAAWKKGQSTGFNSQRAMEEYVKVHADPTAKITKVDTKGDAQGAFANAAKVYKTEYRSDYSYHAQMEPLDAVARFNEAGDQVEVWDGSQDPGRSRGLGAGMIGFKRER